jgi:pilus assembly protein Flp/PilA
MAFRVRDWVARAGRPQEAGQSLVEYGLIVALIAVVAMVAVQALGTGVAGIFTRLLNQISGVV